MISSHPFRFSALVLAGTRKPTDPVAQTVGRRHKALVPVAGVAMLVRVLRTLRASERVADVAVSVDDPGALTRDPDVAEMIGSGAVTMARAGASPSASVAAHIRSRSMDTPLLVTTADHPLLTREMVDFFCSAAERSGSDVCAGLVAESLFRPRYPDARRTFIPMRGERFSGANLFGFMSSRAMAVVDFWAHAEAHRKHPWRLARAFGVVSLALFLLRRLDLEAAFARASKTIGARISAIEMPWAECAIDVDRAEDLSLVTRILAQRDRS